MNDREYTDLWPAGAPGAKGTEPEDRPAIQPVLPKPDDAIGAAVIVCPGGGYHVLAPHEATPVGEWLASIGIAAFVLRYRLAPKYNHPCQINDVQRAIRTVRAHAAQWKVDPERIGVLGFSAGGHLASSAATHFTAGDPQAKDLVERVSSRPNAQVLVYPVITLGAEGHGGSRTGLLGAEPSPELIKLFSNETQVIRETPPAFLVHSTEDTGVPPLNSDLYAASLKAAGVPYEYVRDEMGGHGFGLDENWTTPCGRWLRCWLGE
jgi:acetyl esterase/lipase